jgi:hypothetical protein
LGLQNHCCLAQGLLYESFLLFMPINFYNFEKIYYKTLAVQNKSSLLLIINLHGGFTLQVFTSKYYLQKMVRRQWFEMILARNAFSSK